MIDRIIDLSPVPLPTRAALLDRVVFGRFLP